MGTVVEESKSGGQKKFTKKEKQEHFKEKKREAAAKRKEEAKSKQKEYPAQNKKDKYDKNLIRERKGTKIDEKLKMMKNGNGKNTKKQKSQKIWREEKEMMIQSGSRSTARKINIT